MTTTAIPATIPEQFHAYLAEPRTAVLSIGRGPDRPPNATPVWFNFEHGRFELSITRTRAKYRAGQPSPPDSEILRGLRAEQRVVVTVAPQKVLSWAR